MTVAASDSKRSVEMPAGAGIGLRATHYLDMLERQPSLGFLEVHSENYFGAGGPPHYYLERLRDIYPLSLHGVGLSLGSTDPLSTAHLTKLKSLIQRYQPSLVSEHLCWTSVSAVHTHDLLPMPYSDEAVKHIAARIRQAQDFLGQRILVENVSTYVEFKSSSMPEWEFVAKVVEAADCDLLLDVNNIYVNSINHNFSAKDYISAMPNSRIKEIHLAGYTYDSVANCLVDTHGRHVQAPVWDLYREVILKIGKRPTLIEWDTDIPVLDTLLEEAAHADTILEASCYAQIYAT